MKTSIKILFLAVIMAAISACSAQKRAERHIRRAVELCPEMVQLTAYPIDTFLSVPGYTEQVLVPLTAVMDKGETFVEATEHGTFTVNFIREDSTLCIDYVSDSQQIYFNDTLKYQSVVINPKPPEKGWFDGLGERLAEWITFLIIGMSAAFYLIFKNKKKRN